MKSIKMKGKSIDEAIEAALEVLKASKETAEIRVISEGKPAVMGILGGAEAEVEVLVREGVPEEAKEILQNILDKMGFMAMVDPSTDRYGSVNLQIKGEDISRIIGKEGNMLFSLEVIVNAVLRRIFNEKIRVNVDAGEYREKRIKALERLANDMAQEVEQVGVEKEMPQLSAADRRIVHMFLKDNAKISTYSVGEGRDRKLIIAPKK